MVTGNPWPPKKALEEKKQGFQYKKAKFCCVKKIFLAFTFSSTDVLNNVCSTSDLWDNQ